ncbi:hypothetical protein BSK59_13995 [Paenibacillus odorifer]|uniref:hypothetical protein n=1 Tax=Paenibacillus odorifer TaxID=189426 RepID=UPI00096F7EFA|nr:hypothetical protein [Paenibacillus odorifer]OME55580.1 hypothetical protein BSK59_13995 [Paenibacillus odorifer]
MKLSHEAQTILSMCWEKDERRCHSFIVDGKRSYIAKNGDNYIPTENTYKELEEYQKIAERPFKMIRTGNSVNITGGIIS